MHVRLDEQCVLMPHAELSGEIDAGLIGDRHPGMQRSRHILHADLVRTLMHIEVRTDTMTGAVEEVQAFAPHRLTRQGIDLRACGAIRKLSQLQLDMSLQHQGIDPPHLLGHGTERQGTRDIRRAILILRATVEEQQTVRLQWDVCLGGCLIVDDSAMRVVSGDGVETDVAEKGLLGTQSRQFLVDAHLRLSSCLDSRLEPAQKLHEGDAILEHGTAEAGDLRLVLDGFHGGDRRGVAHDLLCIGAAVVRGYNII